MNNLYWAHPLITEFGKSKEPVPNVYQIKLPKLLTKLLLKYGFLRQFVQDVETVKITRINTGSLINDLIESLNHIHCKYFYEAEEVLIGRDLYQKFLTSDEVRQMLNVSAPCNLRSSYGPTIVGLKVRVIPWMEGFVIIPKER